MARRHYLVTYDVADDKRRNQIFDLLMGHGDHAQYSVFFCELGAGEKVQLEVQLGALLNRTEDQLLFVDLGKAESDLMLRVEAHSRPYQPLVRSTIV